MTLQTEIGLELLSRFPAASSLTLARMAYRDNKSAFASLESARSCFRRLRGAYGKAKRASSEHKQFYRPTQSPGDPFASIPQGKTFFENWGSVQINGPLKALILQDLHVPFHDRDALVAALRHGKANGVDLVLLNGDFADFFSVSFWEKDPRKRDFKGEVNTCRELLKALREGFPSARIVVKEGNHEERWTRYMSVKAPELLGLQEFEWRNVLQLDKIGVAPGDFVGERRPIRLGELNVLHGHEYKFAIQNPVNPARGLFLRCKAYALCGHFHQKSEHSERSVEGKSISTWSTGCLCDMHPDYAPINNWSHGFAFVEVYADGKFSVQNFKIGEGRVY